ncbi:MAG: sulfotransferase [Bacteroidota bacterium]
MEKKWYSNFQSKLLKLNEVRKNKTIVFMICTMRSGSTLLKSLLANAPDTSHLPEIDFQKYNNANAWKINALSTAKIIILKKPASYHDSTYPRIPAVKNSKKIVLVRDVYDTVISLQKMNKAISSKYDEAWSLDQLVHDYWVKTYEGILDRLPLTDQDFRMIKYEDLLQNPVRHTQALFEFIGSAQREGVASYLPPKTFNWEWGKDDGGEKIQSLQVQYKPKEKNNKTLTKIIQDSEQVQRIRKRLGYQNS